MSSLFAPFSQKSVTLRNRVAMSPMCMYSCEGMDGVATAWHPAHYGSRAAGGCGLVMLEATAVTPGGVISPQDLGIWSDDHIPGLRAIAESIQYVGAAAAIQIAHAGRKSGTYRPWSPVRGYVPDWPHPRLAPAAIPFREDTPVPQAMTATDRSAMITAWQQAARRAQEAGFDVLELHSAHGYLLHQFLSPLSHPEPEGGDRFLFHRELVRAVREEWPAEKPLWMRLSVTDWVEGGWTPDDSARLVQELAPLGLDLVDCSSGGTVMNANIPVGPGYQVHLARDLRAATGIATGAVGSITEPAQAEAIVADGNADIVFLGRQLLREPYWALRAAKELGAEVPWPDQYAWSVGHPG